MGDIRPRMTEQEYKVWSTLKERGIDELSDSLTSFEEEAKKMGVNPDDVTSYWAKGQHFSMYTKNKGKTYSDVKDEIVKELDKYSPVYPEIKREKSTDGHLLVIDPADIHIGKLSVATETGETYNIEIAVNRVIDGIQSLLNHASGFEIDQILFIIGNDALHIDHPHRKTTAGTPQDTDGMWHTAFHAAKDMYVSCIETLMQVADVHVIYNPSNHDFTHGFFLADTLASWFRLSKNVTFDSDIRHRKYYKYHSNMIETDHGDGCKLEDTPMLMATEQPIMWSECTFRYSYKHHIHHKKKYGDIIGVNIEVLRSPSSPDGWHDRNGYVNMPAIEGFVHSRERGRVASFSHYYDKEYKT